MAEKPSSTSSFMHQQKQQQQQQQPQQQHCCEICGKSGLTDDTMRDHMKSCHIDGNAICPFCGMSGVAPAELLLHVNQAHLDYLTPENELMSFIDDQSPSIDGDSDSLSEFRDISPMKSPMIDETATNMSYKVNGLAHTTNAQAHGNHACANGRAISVKKSHNKDSNDSYCDRKENSHHQTNGSSMEHSNGIHSSPLRTQLGLNLKSTSATTTPVKKPVISPMTCPLCPYSSDNATILEEHINRMHFDPLSPSVNSSPSSYLDTLNAFGCPICSRTFEKSTDLELHVNIEHRDILSPGNIDKNGYGQASTATAQRSTAVKSLCPVCGTSFDGYTTMDMELHIEKHFSKSHKPEPDLEKEAQKLREQREFEMLRAQYGMDNQGNFREQSAAAMQSAVYAGEMSVADYYERQVGLRAAESHGIDDNTSCTKNVIPRVASLSASSPGVMQTLLCSNIDHYASSYGDKGWGCGYRNLQMMLSSLLQNTTYYGTICAVWNSHTPSRSAMPSISKLQKLVEAAWAQGFDVQGSEQLGCKLYNTRKWIGATEVVTLLSSLRINCQLIDFHRPTSSDGRHPELFEWVLRYFQEKRQQPPLYLQHQGHSRTIIGIEQRASGLTLLVLDPSHGPRQVATLGSSRDSLRLIRRNMTAMRAPQYQIVAVKGLFETEEQYQASKILRSVRIPPD